MFDEGFVSLVYTVTAVCVVAASVLAGIFVGWLIWG